MQWTSSSTILSAHPTDPQVVCLHFPSNQQFSIPSPPKVTSSPTSYEPPTTIISSARDNWIFAYFPGVDCDGVGCVWRKGPQIDNWVVKEWWTFPRGAGVVSARWLQSDREVRIINHPPILRPYMLVYCIVGDVRRRNTNSIAHAWPSSTID